MDTWLGDSGTGGGTTHQECFRRRWRASKLRNQRSCSVDFIIIDTKYYQIEEVVVSGESLTPELVYSLLLMSIAGVSAWWSRYIIENIVALRIAVFVGVSSSIFMLINISG